MELEKARQNSQLNPAEITNLVYSVAFNLEYVKRIRKLIETDPVFDKTQIHNLSRLKRVERAARMARRLLELHKTNSDIPFDIFMSIGQREADEELPTDLHMTMFVPSIATLASDEQRRRWLPLAANFKMVGTYAQTELGHGSDLSHLETIAVFDRAKDGFIMNSPTITSTKWWPGQLGKTANTAVVMAQLYIDNVSYGIQPFLVPIRDYKTHIPLKGVEVFELGPKFGYNANDNGALRLDNIFIPRENMLMKFAQVSKDGAFTIVPGAEKVLYSIMLQIRVHIGLRSSDGLARAVTIALRYAHVRKQFTSRLNPEDKEEMKLIDYQMHQSRILPYLALAFVNVANSEYLTLGLKDLNRRLEVNDFSTLKEMHILASGMKCFFSWHCLEGIESCRRACGGNGFLASAGFTELYNRKLPLITYEGENYVLIQQVTRYLAKLRKQLFDTMNKSNLKGTVSALGNLSTIAEVTKVIPPFCGFLLNPVQNFIGCNEKIYWKDLKTHVQLWESICKYAFLSFPNGELLEEDAVRWFSISMLYISTMTVKRYYEWLQKHKAGLSPKLFEVLYLLGITYSCWLLVEKPKTTVFGLSGSIINHMHIKIFEEIIYECYEKILPDAIKLTDGFDFSDSLLNSTIGRFDGNVYEALYKKAKISDLNQLGDIAPSYTEFIAKL